MGISYNILTDELAFDNYLALGISIVGYKKKVIHKKTGHVRYVRVYPNAKEALQLVGIKTTEKED